MRRAVASVALLCAAACDTSVSSPAKKSAVSDAAAAAVPDAPRPTPYTVGDPSVRDEPRGGPDTHTLRVRFPVTVSEAVPASATFEVRARCAAGDAVFVDHAFASPIGTLAPGRPGDLTAALFFVAPMRRPPSRCELSLTLAPDTPLARACWSGDRVSPGPCTEPWPPPSSKAPLSLSFVQLTVGEWRADQVPPQADGRAYVTVAFDLTAGAARDAGPIAVRVACPIAGTEHVDVASPQLPALAAGEAAPVRATLFTDPIPTPSKCDISVADLPPVCATATPPSVTPGRCAAPVPAAAAPVAIAVSNPRLEVGRAARSPTIRFRATVQAPLVDRTRYDAIVSCRRGAQIIDATPDWGTSLDQVEPGETIAQAIFLDVPADASPCSLTLSYRQPDSDPVMIGRWCLARDKKAVVGGCR